MANIKDQLLGVSRRTGTANPKPSEVDPATSIASELITNGEDFEGLTGWTTTTGTVSVTDGIVKVLQNSGSTAYLSQSISTVAGKYYIIDGYAKSGQTDYGGGYYVGTSTMARDIADVRTFKDTNMRRLRLLFQATGETTHISLVSWGANADFVEFDSISVKEAVRDTSIYITDAVIAAGVTLSSSDNIILGKNASLKFNPPIKCATEESAIPAEDVTMTYFIA